MASGSNDGNDAPPVQNTPPPSYDWQDPGFQERTDKVRDDFYARHPEIDRANKGAEFMARFPEKVEAVRTLDRLSQRDAITPAEYEKLYAEIFNF